MSSKITPENGKQPDTCNTSDEDVREVREALIRYGELAPNTIDREMFKEACDSLRRIEEHLRGRPEPCQHENRKRGGTIWTICEDCGMKWADDEGGCLSDKTDQQPAALPEKEGHSNTAYAEMIEFGDVPPPKQQPAAAGMKTAEEWYDIIWAAYQQGKKKILSGPAEQMVKVIRAIQNEAHASREAMPVELVKGMITALSQYTETVSSVNDPNNFTPQIKDEGSAARIMIGKAKTWLAQHSKGEKP